MDRELLLAMSDLLDQKLKAELQPLKDEICGVKDEVAGLKGEVSALKEDVSALKEDVIACRRILTGLKMWYRNTARCCREFHSDR